MLNQVKVSISDIKFCTYSLLAIASCICDPEMPFVNYHYVTENNGEPMACMCGYFFKVYRSYRFEQFTVT